MQNFLDYHQYQLDYLKLPSQPIQSQNNQTFNFLIQENLNSTTFQSPLRSDISKNTQLSLQYNQIDTNSKKSGHWSNKQKLKYHLFLEAYRKHFEQKQLRRIDKIFKVMAKFIQTRAADQCRSHHQKMQKKYKNFYNILKNLRIINYNTLNSQPIIFQLQSIDQKLINQVVLDFDQVEKQYDPFQIIAFREPLLN